MQTSFRSPRALGVGMLVSALLVAFVLACSTKDDGPQTNIQLATNATLGSYFTDQDGKALYVFSPDVKGSSACTSAGCLATWPVFYQETLLLDAGMNATDFATITRADGAKQTTYTGWPLYRYAQDAASGDTKGENVNGRWFVARNYNVMLAAQGSRLYLSDIAGRSLYLFTNDKTPGVSACSGQCEVVWPVFSVDNVTVPSSLKSADFLPITRTDGKKQLAYKGKPLYYYQTDVARGDTIGGSIKNWYTMAP
ncbi:MAG: hypothetical protein H7Y12_07690 [Sphingobacteriaceae bacterium]|nr:hypothetical protein [Cytophagaceae bacterium]